MQFGGRIHYFITKSSSKSGTARPARERRGYHGAPGVGATGLKSAGLGDAESSRETKELEATREAEVTKTRAKSAEGDVENLALELSQQNNGEELQMLKRWRNSNGSGT